MANAYRSVLAVTLFVLPMLGSGVESQLHAAEIPVALPAVLPEAGAGNLLANPGFEEPAGFLKGWTLERVDPKGELYHYRLFPEASGGHGDARPHTGNCALEIYSANTRLQQTLTLDAGKYLLSVWARNNGDSADPRLLLSFGSQQRRIAVLSDRYRLYYSTFELNARGEVPISFISSGSGIAIDDMTLRRMEPAEVLPREYLYVDLHAAGGERSDNVQTYIRGMKQWLNFTVTAVDAARIATPEITITVPAAVQLTGLNETLLNHYRPSTLTKVQVAVVQSTGPDGQALTSYRFACPRFVNGPENPVSFGGCFVEVPSNTESWVKLSVSDRGAMVTEETLRLIPLDAPSRQRTPQMIKTVAYGVQDWKADAEGRLATIPAQFKLMGLNVWSEYKGPGPKDTKPMLAEERVMAKAATEFGVKEFWPNYSEVLEGAEPAGSVYWDNGPRASDDPDMYAVNPDGSIDKHRFNMRYAAGNGRYWVETVIRGHQRIITKPKDLDLPFRYTGFITDGMERIVPSYDKATLADFALQQKLDVTQVTIESLSGKYAMPWVAYNNALYAKVLDNLARGVREVDPQLKMINTAGNFGSQAGVDTLPLTEQMAWGRSYDYNMPQWYAMRWYGPIYSDLVTQGVTGKVYGKEHGYPDLIPLLCLSMGVQTEDLACIRFKIIDLLSNAPAVRGIAYYIGTNGFADARWMVGISRVHTLVADLEECYVNGTRRDSVAHFVKAGDLKPINGMDDEGRQKTFMPIVNTTCRVHIVDQPQRRVLITLVSHCNQGVGERGKLVLNLKELGTTSGMFIYDHLAGKKAPLTAEIDVDTRNGNLAVLEITDRIPTTNMR